MLLQILDVVLLSIVVVAMGSLIANRITQPKVKWIGESGAIRSGRHAQADVELSSSDHLSVPLAK
jgi:hypothetical protein